LKFKSTLAEPGVLVANAPKKVDMPLQSERRLAPKKSGWGARFPVFIDFTFELNRSGFVTGICVLQGFLLVLFGLVLRFPTCAEATGNDNDPAMTWSIWAGMLPRRQRNAVYPNTLCR
jgi:hypothetical protein